jgi:hypothetical protein
MLDRTQLAETAVQLFTDAGVAELARQILRPKNNYALGGERCAPCCERL